MAMMKNSKTILEKETNLFKEVRIYYNGTDYIGQDNDTDVRLTQYLNSLKKNNFIVGILARQEVQKRIDRAIKIAYEVIKQKPNVHFVFFGDGTLEPEMKKLAASLHLENHLSFLGFV